MKGFYQKERVTGFFIICFIAISNHVQPLAQGKSSKVFPYFNRYWNQIPPGMMVNGVR